MSKESIYFDKTIESVKFYLTFIGLNFQDEVSPLRRWFFIYNFIHLNTDVACEIAWLFIHMATGIDIIEITYIIPCLSLCFLGNAKSLLFLYNMDHVRELVTILKELFKIQAREILERNSTLWKEFRKTNVRSKILLYTNASGVAGFAVGPWFILLSKYYSSGEIKPILPFIVSYPFDYTDLKIYPFVYLHQLWTAWVAVFNVYSTDFFYYACCAAITIQFRTMQRDIEKKIFKNLTYMNEFDETQRAEFLNIIHRHRQLIRCAGLLEKICSRSNLINVVMSSFLICATGFNILAIDNVPLMIPFISFLNLSIIQIFILCYCGDQIMQSSMELSNAIYNCKWYNGNTAAQKDLLIVLMRTQKPCTLTAHGYTIINIRAFTKILSTAWSYFALLTTMYRRK